MNEITMINANQISSPEREAMTAQIANEYAAAATFEEFNSRKSARTLAIYAANLETFAAFLAQTDIVRSAAVLQTSPDAWAFCTFGLVEAFKQWMLQQGYAISTVNLKLSTVKVYIKLAAKAGVIDVTESILIRGVDGYSKKEGKRINERRETIRVGRKKDEHTTIDEDQAERLKAQPDTAQGRRDAVLISLLLDHGLRAGELAGLQISDIDMKRGTMTFYRSKVDKIQTHRFTKDSGAALRRYIEAGDAPAMGALLRGSRKGGKLTDAGMSASNLSKRVQALGERIGIKRLSAHDLRHCWATTAARKGTDAFALRDAGGWNSMAMPGRYVEAAKIANEGVIL